LAHPHLSLQADHRLFCFGRTWQYPLQYGCVRSACQSHYAEVTQGLKLRYAAVFLYVVKYALVLCWFVIYHILYLSYSDAVEIQHHFSFQDIIFRFKAFRIFNNLLSVYPKLFINISCPATFKQNFKETLPLIRFSTYKNGEKVNLKDLSQEEQHQVGIWAYQTLVKNLGYVPVKANT